MAIEPETHCPQCGAPLFPGAPDCSACGVPLVADGRDPLVGRVLLGKYRCLERIGGGGTSTVYRVQHLKVALERALKVLRDDVRARPGALDSFWHEAQVASGLHCPNIPVLHDVDVLEDGTPVSLWQLVSGRTLEAQIVRAPLGSRTATLAAGLCAALAALHERGSAHLDLAPENVLLASSGGPSTAYLIDLGEARPLGAEAARAVEPLRPGFAAPEQLRGDSVDARTDLFSLGALLAYGYAGVPPFRSRDLDAYADELRHLEPSRLAGLGTLPPALRAVIERCLAPDPADRPADAGWLLEALQAALAEPEPGPMSSDPARTARDLEPATTPFGPLGLPFERSAQPALTAAGPGGAVTNILPAEVATGPRRASRPAARLEPLAQAPTGTIELRELTTFGRADVNSATIDHPTVSKRHARIYYNSGAYFLEDLSSRNGSGVNGERIDRPVALQDGDQVILGEVVYRFRCA